MLRLLRVSLGGMFQFLVATASWLGLDANRGDLRRRGHRRVHHRDRIIIFALLPSWGMSNAAATLVGQNLGAGKPDRAERSVWVTGFTNMVFFGGVTVVFTVFAEPMIRIFTHEEAALRYGTDALRFISYGYIFYAYGMVMVAAFNGAGDTLTPTLINLCCYWLFQIPLAYTLAFHTSLGARGIFLAITIAETTIAVVGILLSVEADGRRRRYKPASTVIR